MNPDLIAQIVLACSFFIYIGFKIYDSQHDEIESSLIKALKDIAQSLKEGNSLETAVSEQAKRPEYFSRYFERVLHLARQGRSFEEALESAGRKSPSKMFRIVSDVLIQSQRSKKKIPEILVRFADHLDELQSQQKDLAARMGASMTTLRFISIIILPLIYVFLTSLFGFSLDVYAYAYLFFLAFIISMADVILFNDVRETIFFLPLGLSGFYISLLQLGPILTSYVSSFV